MSIWRKVLCAAGAGAALVSGLSIAVAADLPSYVAKMASNLYVAGYVQSASYLQSTTNLVVGTYASLGAYVTTPYHVVPDFYKQIGDGEDDAPSIQRAAASCARAYLRCEIDFLPRLYQINSNVDLTEKQVVLKGMGIQERTPQIAGTTTVSPWGGTWLQVSNTSVTPFTLGGYGGGNTEVRDLGIYEVQPTPPTSGTWTPAAYGPFFTSAHSLLPIRYHNIFMLGITAGIYSDADQRVQIEDVRGQVFHYAIGFHRFYDMPTIQDVHVWTYWSAAAPVLTYQQANTDAIVLGRVDGAFIDKVFCYACRAAYHIVNDGDEGSSVPGGTATKIITGSTYCDFTYACIFVDSDAANFDMSAISMSSQGQSATLSPAAPIPGASSFILNGYGNLNIHELYTQFADRAVGQFLNGSVASNVTIGAMRFDASGTQANGFLFGGVKPTTHLNTVVLATKPLMLGVEPSGMTVFQPGSSLNVIEPSTITVTDPTTP